MATEADLALVREGFDRYARGDLEGMLELAVEDGLETHMPETLPNGGTYYGHDEYRRWMGRWLEAWEDFHIEVLEIEPVGERHVLTTTHQRAVGRGSGIAVEQSAYYLNEVGGGKILCVHLYLTRDEALAAAAAREAGAPARQRSASSG